MKFLNFIAIATLLAGTFPFPAHAMDVKEDILRIGKPGSTANKSIRLGSGTQGQLRFNTTTNKMEFANDGSTFLGIGAGGGGGGGIELLSDNPNFESGVTSNWISTLGSTITSRTGANALFDSVSARFTPSVSGQTFSSQAYAVPVGLAGGACLASIRYITTEATNYYTLSVVDGSANVLGTTQIFPNAPATVSQNAYVPFTCGAAASTVKLVVTATSASAAFIDLDNAHLGSDNRLADVSQAQFVGGVEFTTSTMADYSGSTAWADVTASGPVYTGRAASMGGSTAGFTINNLEPGTYFFTTNSPINKAGAAACSVLLALTDGTNRSPLAASAANTAEETVPGIVWTKQYTSSQNLTVRLQTSPTTTGTCIARATAAAPAIYMFKYPASSENTLRVDQLGWKVHATIANSGNTNVPLSLTTASRIVVSPTSGLTLANVAGSGNIPASIACSGTNPATGTTCSAGTPEIGISFNAPTSGDVLVCANFTYGGAIGSGGNLFPNFNLVETSNTNDATVITQGKNVLEASITGTGTSFSMQNQFPFRLCQQFPFASAGLHTIRMFYATNNSGTVNSSYIATGNSTAQPDVVTWEAYPLSYLSSALPVFRGQVTSNTSGKERVERVSITGSSSTPTISSQSGSWLNSSVSRVAAGNYVLSINTGIFSSAPSCICVDAAGAGTCTMNGAPSTSSVNIYTRGFTSGTGADDNLQLICMGPQ